jgi:hypothetical protein
MLVTKKTVKKDNLKLMRLFLNKIILYLILIKIYYIYLTNTATLYNLRLI